MKAVEPVFGQGRQGRGFRQFLLWGLEEVNREWLLICTGHNLLKLFWFERPAPASAGGQRSAQGVHRPVESHMALYEHR